MEPQNEIPRGEKPKYQILEKCYLPVLGAGGTFERVLDPEAMPYEEAQNSDDVPQRKPLIVVFDGVPAHYMKPLNAAARAMCKKHEDRMSFNDPINKLTQVGTAAATA